MVEIFFMHIQCIKVIHPPRIKYLNSFESIAITGWVLLGDRKPGPISTSNDQKTWNWCDFFSVAFSRAKNVISFGAQLHRLWPTSLWSSVLTFYRALRQLSKYYSSSYSRSYIVKPHLHNSNRRHNQSVCHCEKEFHFVNCDW